MQARIEAEEAFRQLAEGLGQSGTPAFFETLVQQLAATLAVDHVLIARVGDEGQAQTLAVWSNGRLRENLRYALAGTPCETVVGQAACHYPRDVQALFPDDALLSQLDAQSYLGLPLFAVDGSPIGLLAVLKNRPMTIPRLANEVLGIAAAQAGAELGRREAEAALQASEAHARESERRLNTLLNHLPGMAYRRLHDPTWTMTLVSRGAKALTGHDVADLLDNRVISYGELVHPADRAHALEEVQAAIDKGAPFRVIYRLLPAGGGIRWMWEQGQAVLDERGRVVCLEGFISDITEQHEAQRVQEAVMQVASTVTTRLGDDYFHQLVGNLVQILEADAGFIALLEASPPDPETPACHGTEAMSMVSAVCGEQPLASYDFPVAGTPCEQLLEEHEAMVRDGDIALLPGSSDRARAWIGRRLDNARGEPIGAIMVLYRRALEASAFATSVLRILSTGAAAELERRRDHRRMHQLAFTDGTTGLPNRVRFMEELSRLRREAEQAQHPLALLMLDIRRFKEVNDLHGHQVGDQLLARVADRLRRSVTRDEILARLSGDEFAVLAPLVGGHRLQDCLERLREAFGRPFRLGHRTFLLDASIGTAQYPRDALVAGELFKFASIALYHAKQQDNGVCPFTESMTRTLQRRRQLTERLNAALLHGRLELHYQPQVDLRHGELVGAEALCRWYDDEWGWVSPGEFIPLAEARGLIRPLGDWVLREAARQLAVWRQDGLILPGRLSINVSAQQFADPWLAQHVATLMQGVSASTIALELTESDFMRDPEQAVGITRALREAGYALAIDDFGTGYSSLAYLRRFAADALKIDISFVREMLDSRHDQAIVQTIIAMARALEMKTVAEGVETREQAEVLARLGCDQAQGFYFGRPLPAAAFCEAWGNAMQDTGPVTP
ncbi:EAL domain-containing protein [Halomonas cerina]|uniref:Diguanylate cyclase (GGDEF)-like protein/PAS domain S-box-containing protein n=1 Tax=Halomonas cerina TaxID=447424 RepID=A0A839V6S2_9GAMM|nr:EAL domain-containing protein [Halomonas cerina]MBB3189239.1 diguanylate cyclase (GGDEF)-like protein/PAS domain S-box-containing protein [Halomonas cerina]